MSPEVTRVLLQTSPVEGMPGWEMRLFLITCPPGADASNHSHPVVGIGLVLEGMMISAFDDDPEEIFTAGQGRCSASLPAEAFKGLSVFRKIIGKEFQGHEASKFGVLGFVHHAHTTATESFKDAVAGDGLPEEWLRVRHGAVILGCDREQVNEGTRLKYLIRSQIVVFPEKGGLLSTIITSGEVLLNERQIANARNIKGAHFAVGCGYSYHHLRKGAPL